MIELDHRPIAEVPGRQVVGGDVVGLEAATDEASLVVVPAATAVGASAARCKTEAAASEPADSRHEVGYGRSRTGGCRTPARPTMRRDGVALPRVPTAPIQVADHAVAECRT